MIKFKLEILLLLISIIKSPCPEADTRCLRCGGDRCINCIDSFSNSSGLCITVRSKIENCLSYKNENECKECMFGYRVSEDAKCIKIDTIEDCLQLDVNGDCKYCNSGFIMQDGKCVSGSCSTIHCAVCNIYNEVETCQICKDNFVIYPYSDSENENMTMTSCIHENGRTIGCQLARYQDPRECMKCRLGYYYADGRCLRTSDYDFSFNFENNQGIIRTFILVVLFQYLQLF